MSNSFDAALSSMQEQRPLIHVISNMVTLTDVVNVILAAGGTAIAADDPQETAQISNLSQALYLNIGMPSDRKLEAMLEAGRAANTKGIPVVLDPVGAGSSTYREHFLKVLLSELSFTCIRGNAAEMAFLAGVSIESHGVEAGDAAGAAVSVQCLQSLARKLSCILVVSGETDLVISPAGAVYESSTGSSLARRITGSGCMLGGLLATFLGAESQPAPEEDLELARRFAERENNREDAARVKSKNLEESTNDWVAWDARTELLHQVVRQYGLAEEAAEQRMLEVGGGTGTYHLAFMDAISRWNLGKN